MYHPRGCISFLCFLFLIFSPLLYTLIIVMNTTTPTSCNIPVCESFFLHVDDASPFALCNLLMCRALPLMRYNCRRTVFSLLTKTQYKFDSSTVRCLFAPHNCSRNIALNVYSLFSFSAIYTSNLASHFL